MILKNKLVGLVMFVGALLFSTLVTAPIPLAGTFQSVSGIPVDSLLRELAHEQELVRLVWTQEIMEKSKQVGLLFNEHWREPGYEAGPLPALLLRDIANRLEYYNSSIGMSIASDFPIHSAHYFQGEFAERFALLKTQRLPQFFYSSSVQAYTFMMPDIATTQACVSCHNAHPKSPKQDWKLHDIMGGITITYPHKTVTPEQFQQCITLFRQSVRDIYELYLEKTRTFASPPAIGNPENYKTFVLPDAESFMQLIMQRYSQVPLLSYSKIVTN